MDTVSLRKAVEKCNSIAKNYFELASKLEIPENNENDTKKLILKAMRNSHLDLEWLFQTMKETEVYPKSSDPIIECVWRLYQRIEYPYNWQVESSLSETTKKELFDLLDEWFKSNKPDLLSKIKPALSNKVSDKLRRYKQLEFVGHISFDPSPKEIPSMHIDVDEHRELVNFILKNNDTVKAELKDQLDKIFIRSAYYRIECSKEELLSVCKKKARKENRDVINPIDKKAWYVETGVQFMVGKIDSAKDDFTLWGRITRINPNTGYESKVLGMFEFSCPSLWTFRTLAMPFFDRKEYIGFLIKTKGGEKPRTRLVFFDKWKLDVAMNCKFVNFEIRALEKPFEARLLMYGKNGKIKGEIRSDTLV